MLKPIQFIPINQSASRIIQESIALRKMKYIGFARFGFANGETMEVMARIRYRQPFKSHFTSIRNEMYKFNEPQPL
jgi:hypothetical protein